jgi:hypothetical protein
MFNLIIQFSVLILRLLQILLFLLSHQKNNLPISFSPCSTHPLSKSNRTHSRVITNYKIHLSNIESFLCNRSSYYYIKFTLFKLLKDLRLFFLSESNTHKVFFFFLKKHFKNIIIIIIFVYSMFSNLLTYEHIGSDANCIIQRLLKIKGIHSKVCKDNDFGS